VLQARAFSLWLPDYRTSCPAATILSMLKLSRLCSALLLSSAIALTGCSPEYNWREVRSDDGLFVALFPAKPASHTKEVNLDGIHTKMSMTAAEVNGAMFAIGSAQVSAAELVQPALTAMKTAMVRNIGGSVTSDKIVPGPVPYNDVVADGSRNGQALRLTARFGARNQRVYQVVIIGAPRNIPADAVDTFIASFKPGE
jgi:hypothetical protein